LNDAGCALHEAKKVGTTAVLRISSKHSHALHCV
jgi:hypothetical protein